MFSNAAVCSRAVMRCKSRGHNDNERAGPCQRRAVSMHDCELVHTRSERGMSLGILGAQLQGAAGTKHFEPDGVIFDS